MANTDKEFKEQVTKAVLEVAYASDIANAPVPSVRQVAAQVGEAKSVVGRVFVKLQNAGLIDSLEDGAGRRLPDSTTLTEKGRQAAMGEIPLPPELL